MARSRNIKPGFFRNEHLAECSPLARLLFIGLWCEADREGRLEDRPKRLKVALLPYDDCSMHDLMTELVQKGFIVRYSVGGTAYIQIANFLKHQQPHHKEVDSVIPSPEYADSHAQAMHEPSMTQASGKQIASCPTSSLDSLIPDSLIPDPLTNGHAPKPRVASRFAEFWNLYPLKKNRKDAEDAWRSRRMDHKPEFITKILEDLADRASKDPKWVEGFIPHASTYIRKQRWEDAW